MPTGLPRVCSCCGRAIPAGNLGDRCPSCLLRYALEPASAGAAEPGGVLADAGQCAGNRLKGNYEIFGEIAQGGMGVVYRARQLGVGRMVALKMIRGSAVASAEMRMRFQLEAAAVGRLDHPNIVSLIETGEHQGELFIALGLVEGNSLAELSAGCTLRDAVWLRRCATLLATVARAVHYAHQRGVLHRDLKPSNILVDDRGEPKVTDFGLAKIHESDAGLTRSGAVLGSPNYMPPEQAAGPAHTLTTAADVYSLGAILYQMICGQPPFEAPTAVETMRRVVDSDLVPPRRLNPEVDRDLESICRKCLEKEPQRRFSSAADLAGDLERWLAGLPTHARPMVPIERAWRWCRRNPALASLTLVSGICLVALMTGAAFAIHRIQTANRESQALLRRLQLEQAESYFADGDSARGIALLAHLLRAQPNDLTAGIRLKSALELRPIARPFTRPWLAGSEILALGFDPAESRGVVLSRQGELHVCNLETGAASTFGLSGGEPLVRGAISRDATRLASAHADGTVMLWDVARPQPAFTVLEHPGPVRFLEFDPQGGLLATGCEDGSVRVWVVDTGVLHRPVMQHPGMCRAAAFNPGARMLATGCEDGVARIWPIDGDGGPTMAGSFPNAVWVISFDPAGTRLAAGSVHGHVRIWPLSREAGSALDLFFAAALTDLQFSPSGHLVAVAGWSSHSAAQVWHTDTGQPAAPPLAHRANVTGIRFSPDGGRLLTLSQDTTARVWSTEDWTPVVDALVHVGGVANAAWGPSGRRVATGSYAGVVWWELPGPEPAAMLWPDPGRILTATSRAKSGRLLTLSSDGTLRSWGSARSGALVELKLSVDAPSLAVFSPSGRTVALVSPELELRVFETDSGIATTSPMPLPGPPSFAAISPLDDAILAGTADGILWRFRLTRAGSRIELCRVEGLQGVMFSPDGRRLATVSSERTARIWDATSGKPLTPPLLHDGAVEHAAFSPDGTWLATASSDSYARVWHAVRGNLLGNPLPHNARVDQVVFDPSARFLATTSADGATRIWTIGTYDAPPVVIQHGANLGRAAFNADGTLLLIVSRDGVARAWDPRSGVPVTEPFRHPVELQDAGFHPDAECVWTLTADGTVRLWPLPSYDPSEAESLPAVAELMGRMFLERPNRFRVTPTDRWDGFPRRPLGDRGERD
jgi:eukaryotic-like serine/threonine-protein kinase